MYGAQAFNEGFAIINSNVSHQKFIRLENIDLPRRSRRRKAD